MCWIWCGRWGLFQSWSSRIGSLQSSHIIPGIWCRWGRNYLGEVGIGHSMGERLFWSFHSDVAFTPSWWLIFSSTHRHCGEFPWLLLPWLLMLLCLCFWRSLVMIGGMLALKFLFYAMSSNIVKASRGAVTNISCCTDRKKLCARISMLYSNLEANLLSTRIISQ